MDYIDLMILMFLKNTMIFLSGLFMGALATVIFWAYHYVNGVAIKMSDSNIIALYSEDAGGKLIWNRDRHTRLLFSIEAIVKVFFWHITGKKKDYIYHNPKHAKRIFYGALITLLVLLLLAFFLPFQTSILERAYHMTPK